MASDDRLIEIVAELLEETRQFRQDSNVRFERLEKQQIQTNSSIERLEEQQKKTNLAIGELRLSVMKLADQVEKLVDIEQRLRVLEDIVLRKAS
jgi:TolA-binding protein